MDKKAVIFLTPLSDSLLKLKEVLQRENEVDVYEVGDILGGVETFTAVQPALWVASNSKKALQFTTIVNFRKVPACRFLVLSPLQLPDKVVKKMAQYGIKDILYEPMTVKVLTYKIKLLIKAIPDRKDDLKEENATVKAKDVPITFIEEEKKKKKKIDLNLIVETVKKKSYNSIDLNLDQGPEKKKSHIDLNLQSESEEEKSNIDLDLQAGEENGKSNIDFNLALTPESEKKNGATDISLEPGDKKNKSDLDLDLQQGEATQRSGIEPETDDGWGKKKKDSELEKEDDKKKGAAEINLGLTKGKKKAEENLASSKAENEEDKGSTESEEDSSKKKKSLGDLQLEKSKKKDPSPPAEQSKQKEKRPKEVAEGPAAAKPPKEKAEVEAAPGGDESAAEAGDAQQKEKRKKEKAEVAVDGATGADKDKDKSSAEPDASPSKKEKTKAEDKLPKEKEKKKKEETTAASREEKNKAEKDEQEAEKAEKKKKAEADELDALKVKSGQKKDSEPPREKKKAPALASKLKGEKDWSKAKEEILEKLKELSEEEAAALLEMIDNNEWEMDASAYKEIREQLMQVLNYAKMKKGKRDADGYYIYSDKEAGNKTPPAILTAAEIPAEDEAPIIPVENNGIHHAVSCLKLVQKGDSKINYLFSYLAECIYKETKGIITYMVYNPNGQVLEDIYVGSLNLSILTDKEKENYQGEWKQLRKDNYSRWELARLQTWSDDTFRSPNLELIFPFYQGFDRMGLGVVLFSAELTAHKAKMVEMLVECARIAIATAYKKHETSVHLNGKKDPFLTTRVQAFIDKIRTLLRGKKKSVEKKDD